MAQDVKRKSTRDGFGEALLSLAKKNKNIVIVSADLAESTRVSGFAKKYPTRFIEVGVAEQNMISVAAGLALSGKVAIASSFAVFSPGRNWDQLRVSVCYSQANVKIIGSHTGLGAGEDGASHQALEDIAITRCLPNLVVIAPADYNEAKKALVAAITHQGPVYLRLTRQNTPVFTNEKNLFKIGQADVLKKGQDVTLIACGPMVYEALEVAKKLASENINAEVINCHTIKPLDKKTILASVKKTKKVVTIEDHQIHGGMGSAVAEMLAENFPVPMKIMGVNDTFGESGRPEELYKKYDLSQEHIISNIKKLL
jgi:transketolase